MDPRITFPGNRMVYKIARTYFAFFKKLTTNENLVTLVNLKFSLHEDSL